MFEEDNLLNDEHSFGGWWTNIKLEALEKYLVAFNTVLSKQSFTRIYIDGFAGTGRCDITVNGAKTSIDGSARRALGINPAFHKFCFIELDAKKMSALKFLQVEHPEKPIDIIQDDANAALKAICKNHNWRNTRAVLFLDPYGLHVEWSTLKAIADTKAIDLWYLFPYSGLYRQTAKNANALDVDKENSITRILGTDEWRQEFYKPQRQADIWDFDGGDQREANHQQILEYVSKRLKQLFPSVTAPKILYQRGDSRNPRGAPLFALYFAVSNPSDKANAIATGIANHILKSL
jgi:three-Cys-motif partner protein